MMKKIEKLISAANHAAVVRVPTRKIPEHTRLQLCVRAGGRCEFDSCNEYLFEHPLTYRTGIFGEMAHMVAFRRAGPRGRGSRPVDINNEKNLMLLCPTCHKLIDDNPCDYSLQTLQEYKTNHEARIRHVTALGQERRTAVLVFRALIEGDTVTVPVDQIVEATAPRYPLTPEPLRIDLTGIPGSSAAFYTMACETSRAALLNCSGPKVTQLKRGIYRFSPLGQ